MEHKDEPAESSETFDQAMYLDIMREDPPLKRYVSRGDTPDAVDIPGPHQDADRAVFRAIRFTMSDGTPRFQPILGSAGMGKTHLYWVIKEQEEYFAKGRFLAVYVPSPPAPVRVPLHLHACVVDEGGDALFEQTVDMLVTKIGGLKGATAEMYDYTYAMDRLLTDYPGISADVVKVLLRYRLDPSIKDLARRWLFGDALNDNEIDRLAVRSVLEEDDVTMATLKLLFEGSEIPIVLFVDEMEGPYNTHGEEGERHFLEILKRIYNECKNVVIISSALTEIWDRIYQIADAPTRSRMEPVIELRHFTKEDIDKYVKATMVQYWKDQNIAAPPDLLFPLTESDINEAFKHSKGVPREAIRHIIPRLETILFETPTEEIEPQDDYVIKLTATVVLGAIVKGLSIAAKKEKASVNLQMSSGGTQKQSAAIVILTQNETEYKIGIDVPNVKDWNRSGGVAAFYSAKRLKDALESKEVKYAMMAAPEGTKGAKFEAIREEMSKKSTVLYLTEDTAISLVETTNKNKLLGDHKSFFSDFVKQILG